MELIISLLITIGAMSSSSSYSTSDVVDLYWSNHSTLEARYGESYIDHTDQIIIIIDETEN
jgi:hypothetical protein